MSYLAGNGTKVKFSKARTEVKILVVDDSTTNNLLCQAIFEDEGYTVILKYSVKEAREYLCTEKPDLILLDIMMPGEDGLHYLEEIMTNPATATVPVIIVSSRDDQRSVKRALKNGALEYVQKPIGVHNLQQRVKQVLKQRHII